MRLCHIGIVLGVLGVFIARCEAYEQPDNPDRWPSTEFSISGMLPFTGETDFIRKGGEQDQNSTSKSITPALSGRIPLSPTVTVEGGTSVAFVESQADEAPNVAGHKTDTASLGGSLSARYYWLNRHLTGSDVSKNPDQWPSMALSGSTSGSLHYRTMSTLQGVVKTRDDNSQTNSSLGLDVRLPLNNQWTFLSSMAGTWTKQLVPTTDTAPEVQSTTTGLAASLGAHYYFVDHNYILHDHHENPDQWTSFTWLISGVHRLSGQQTTNNAGVETSRDLHYEEIGLSGEYRAPLTDQLTLRFGAGGQYSRLSTMETTTLARTIQPLSAITLNAGLRYYFD